MRTIAITGRSGCGKSSVTAYYVSLGYPVADADAIARQVMEPGSPCLVPLCRLFGEDILDENGVLRRRLLADRAFATPEGTQALTKITHPEITHRLLLAKQQAAQSGAELFFADGAVILGSAFEAECDRVLLVAAPLETSVQRICQRDGISPEMARRRLDAQPSEAWLRAKADYILENDADLPTLRQRADTILKQLQNGGRE